PATCASNPARVSVTGGARDHTLASRSRPTPSTSPGPRGHPAAEPASQRKPRRGKSGPSGAGRARALGLPDFDLNPHSAGTGTGLRLAWGAGPHEFWPLVGTEAGGGFHAPGRKLAPTPEP